MVKTREVLEVDVLFVGAGPASLSGALHLQNLIEAHNSREQAEGKKLGPVSIAVIEKGREIGAHILSGAILDPRALKELMPDLAELDIPLACPVTRDSVYYLTSRSRIRFPLIPPPLNNHGNYVISLNRFIKWLGERVEAKGVELFPGFAGTRVARHWGLVTSKRSPTKVQHTTKCSRAPTLNRIRYVRVGHAVKTTSSHLPQSKPMTVGRKRSE